MKSIAEIMRLLQEQSKIMQEILEEKIMAEGGRVMTELYQHRRDDHLKYWDPSYYLECKKKQDEKMSELRKKMEENKKKIAEMIKEAESGEEKLSFPPCADDYLTFK